MDIVFRAALVFLFLWVITRVVGRTTLGELSTFELLLYIVMGDLIQQAVTQQDYSLFSAVLAIGVFALMTIALSYASWRWPALRTLIRGTPVLVLQRGTPLTDVMRRQRLTIDDLMAAAREQGIRRLSDVEVAVLEADGSISFFKPESGSAASVADAASGASDKPRAAS
ncbi:MAG: hypothetical protein QOK30_2190 [Nocardioidaceae bacterium]|jgi:uncharacterized membrane protein YcaP (DUF421 family)|nr:hypothetical protein [Nocardioidaceae bacterium]